MPSVIETRVDDQGIYVKASDSSEVTVTSAEILSHSLTVPGTAIEVRLNTRAWIKNRIAFGLTPGMVLYEEIELDYDPVTGIPTHLELT